ncbi:hypothetical protein WJX73_000054 [Symbiochloris irregularis]|uniref:Uncharacterized protein n=1 Tax=Symbiochloris irregularis TaxID=706552 RepID=A0AAW1P125_9CHLO
MDAGKAPSTSKLSAFDVLRASSRQRPNKRASSANLEASLAQQQDATFELCPVSQVSGTALGLAAGGKVTMRLITSEPPAAGGAVTWGNTDLQSNVGGRTFKGSPSLLKSALQKNVRLGRAGSAVRCALQLLKDNAGELLRRLSIICLEDAVLHPQLPLIVWLMAAHAKGYELGWHHADACLAIVSELASVSKRDCWPSCDSSASDERQKGPLSTDGQGPCNDAESILVTAISIRAVFGGMAGDVAMLKSFAEVWQRRFAGRAEPPPRSVSNAEDRQPPAAVEDPAAADGQWLLYLQQLYTSLQCDPGPKAMWRHRSSTNHKQELGGTERCQPESPQLSRLWAVAAPAAEQWSAAFIRSRFT